MLCNIVLYTAIVFTPTNIELDSPLSSSGLMAAHPERGGGGGGGRERGREGGREGGGFRLIMQLICTRRVHIHVSQLCPRLPSWLL